MSADTITTEQLTAIKAYATESAACFVDEFPGEELGDSDWDSTTFEMRHDWDDVDDAFSIFRKHLVAEIARLNLDVGSSVVCCMPHCHARLNLERLQATLTRVNPAHLSSLSLRKEAEDADYNRECYKSTETVGADAIEILFWPELNRAGVAAGSDAEWTDASSAADALRRFLNDDMSP